MPPGTLSTVWGDDARFELSYLSEHPGYYLSGDGGFLDEVGYLFVMGRTDDVINVAGHRFSTGAIEAVLATHPAVAECAVSVSRTGSRVRFLGASLCSKLGLRRMTLLRN
jgi:propionyl-CoA synthetase